MESRRQFVEGFERAFVVQQNGTLKCDKVIRPVVQVIIIIIIVRDIIIIHIID